MLIFVKFYDYILLKKNREKYDGKQKQDRNQHGPSEKRIALSNIKQVKTDGAGNTSAS